MLSRDLLKRVLLVGVLVFSGCAVAQIPTYLQDKKPYTRRLYADYQAALEAITEALERSGWKVQRLIAPSVYEQNTTSDLDEQQVLILTEIRKTPLFVGTRYARMNVFLRSKKGISEIEIRYLTVTSLPLKSFKTYKNDSEVRRIFDHIIAIISDKAG